ncbi:ATP-grasp domain-containing protein [Methylomarinum sp. Ch1-1]|uniref:ATP-grasp domain-containing protein n=1 Tax=Methylomarinum roseum TaxID=3067653 RepID=A0AAU7NRR5_9GAMM|nr:ATP-grasp domain-containing protein [Methylomarinum sp. Ch1-1]MDP4520354.1 ATP-grasp domain-containing protein [Methylomarinum sp. Ch1-1]
MMLQTLLAELKSIDDIEPVILLDWRCELADLPERTIVHRIDKDQDYRPVLLKLMRQCRLFWPIAPETDGALLALVELAEAQSMTTLASSPAAIALCGSKLATSRYLRRHNINAIETERLTAEVPPRLAGKMVIKPDDGAGAEDSFIVSSLEDYRRVVGRLQAIERYVMQPYRPGRAISLSCLFKQGRAWLLCCNGQQLSVSNGQFRLMACQVNIRSRTAIDYARLIEQVARAIPGLWGYVGIDLIETEREAVILEINPRLTSSYDGIVEASGINVAEQVLRLLDGEPVLRKTRDTTVMITLDKECN